MESLDPMALAPCPDHLSRRISEIDLNSRGPRDVLPEYGPRYSRSQLLNLRSETDGRVDTTDFKFDGVMTPPSVSHPDVPPSTPADLTLEGDCEAEEEHGGQTIPNGEEKKKKKKKKSRAGKSKTAPVTGFEGLCQRFPFVKVMLKALAEFYADAPITPDEHEEECDLYNE
jgi:hypothetical protein